MRKEFTRAEKWLRENPLVQALLKRSHLDEKTFKALLLYHWNKGVTFEELAKKLDVQQPGAWKRWRRGRDMVMRSFYTIELAICAGVLEPETAELLAQDLLDYASLSRGEEDASELRDRIEERMVKLAKLVRGE